MSNNAYWDFQKRVWDYNKQEYIAMPDYLKSFYDELIALFKKYDLSISHEDYYGSFIVDNYDENNVKWLTNAYLEAKIKLPEDLSQPN